MTGSLPLDAFTFGLISAASLPLGALVSFIWTPRNKAVAAMMAFGGGALLAALTIDLAGPALERGHFYALAGGCIIGGLLFDFLNQVVNNKGGFLRKTATTIEYMRKRRVHSAMKVFEQLSRVPLFNQLPPEEIRQLTPYIHGRSFKNGTRIVHQGDPGDSLFIIEQGQVDILDDAQGGNRIARLNRSNVFGEMALLTGEPRAASAIAVTDTKAWIIYKEDFDRILKNSPALAETVHHLAEERISDLKDKQIIDEAQANQWFEQATGQVEEEMAGAPTSQDIKEAAKEHSGAPLAIWLGILLDGIPESLVIGSSLIAGGHAAAEGHVTEAAISFSLLAGLFLSNFPEALSSSVGMREQNYSRGKIFSMWGSLMVLTGLGAVAGFYLFSGLDHSNAAFSLVEGVAAGAMLTMIAETMLPEASHKGGAIVGFSTLLGFLAAIFFKTLQ